MLKFKVYVLFLFIFGICTITFVNAKINNFPLAGKVIYIDPGHGGVDPGAVYKNIKESDLTLSISKKIATDLEKTGAIIYLTRDDDYDLASPKASRRKLSDLSNRTKLINESGCDLFISIHLNAERTGLWHGAQIFYSDSNKNNSVLAEYVQERLKKDKISERKISKIEEDVYMYKNINSLGVLIEVGFLSNYNDRTNLLDDEYQNLLSKSIINGIIEYLKH